MYNIYSVNMNTKNEKETKENNLSAFQKEWPPDRKEQESFLRSLFLICPPPPLPPGQERCKQFPFHGPEELDISLGLPWGIDIVTGQIEPYIIMTAQTLPQRQSF